MTNEFKKTVLSYVNVSEKIERAYNNAERTNLYKMEAMLNVVEKLVDHRIKLKESFMKQFETESFTEEEYEWFMQTISPYIVKNNEGQE